MTPVISKLFESVILQLTQNKMQTDNLQFGFKKGLGCADAIFTLGNVADYLTCNGSTASLYI